MTTDVINGVPRSLLEGIADHLEWDGSEPLTTIQYAYKCDDLARDLRALLATAQPAADGERASFEAELNRKWPDAPAITRVPRSKGERYDDPDVQLLWEGWQARAAQPQQAVAVTDEVRRLREALESKVPLYEAVERACGELPDGWAITLQMENGAGWVELYDAEGNQVEDFPTNNERLDYTLNDAVDAARAAHKTGEEE